MKVQFPDVERFFHMDAGNLRPFTSTLVTNPLSGGHSILCPAVAGHGKSGGDGVHFRRFGANLQLDVR